MTMRGRPRVVLLHGVGLDHTMWEPVVERLSTVADVLTPDLLGHGGRAPVASGLTLGDLARDVVEALDEPVHLVGFSLGGLVAQEIGIEYPAKVRSLTLVSTVADRSDEQRLAVRRRYERAAESFEASAHAAVDRWFGPSLRATRPELPDTILTTLLGNDRTSYLAAYRVFAEADGELWPRTAHISVPTLVVTGDRDGGSTPAMTHRLAARIPGARARIIDDAAHLLPLERPTELAAAIRNHLAESQNLTETP
ncbi:alpha/beta fold hydrolase [Nocardia sp. CA-084685]|uniref:alpha/beta fold hydrolase n=1 Tax=Nocardia sp. CA-084685 TaxID=3239970 RepID=UPI003D9773A1